MGEKAAKTSHRNAIWSRRPDSRPDRRQDSRHADRRFKPEPISIWTSKRVSDNRDREVDLPPKPAKSVKRNRSVDKEETTESKPLLTESEAQLDEHIKSVRAKNEQRLERL